MDSVLASLRRAITAKARSYPQPNFSSYITRRLKDKLAKDKLAQMNSEQLEQLAGEMRGELEQLKRMCEQAKSLSSKEGYATILQHSEAEAGHKKE